MSLPPSRILQLALENLEEQRRQVVAEIDTLRQRANDARPAAKAKRKYTRRLGRKPGRHMSEEQKLKISLAMKKSHAARHVRAQSGRSSEAVS